MEYLRLSNGNQMPKIGLGTDDVLFVRKLRSTDNRLVRKILNVYHYRFLKPYLNYQLAQSIAKAINMGYRLIDTSAAYTNESAIGKALKMSKIKREEIFITTRVTNRQQYNHQVRESFYKSLENLSIDYVDLYMFHWPVTGYFLDTWREMEKLYDEGLVKNLGIANCHQHHIQEILRICKIKPVVNQFEIHPLFSQKPLVEYCKSQDIQVEAYSPIAQNNDRLRRNRVLHGLASKYGKTIHQIILRWHIENGVIPIPRSTNENRLRQNIDVFDFKLTKDEIEDIDKININSRLRYDPDNCDFTLL